MMRRAGHGSGSVTCLLSGTGGVNVKRRWVVVMLGLRGLATGHRSEISRHRSQDSARIAALEALARLREGQAPVGPEYTIVIEYEGQQFLVDAEDRPPVTDPWAERGRAASTGAPGPIDELLGEAALEQATDDESVREPVPVTPQAEQAPAEEAVEPATSAQAAAGTEDAQTEATEAPRVRRRRESEPETPEGPVPEGLLSRWEEKVAAYDAWEARQSGPDSEDQE